MSKKGSKNASQQKKRARQEKIQKNLGTSQRIEENIKYQFGEKANPHSENQEHEMRNHHQREEASQTSSESSTQKLYDDDKGEEDTTKNEDEAMKIEDNLRTSNEYRSSRQGKSKTRLIVSSEGKAGDSSGIRAEQIKTCDEGTEEWIRQVFNEILQEEDCTPQTWRQIRIQVIHKKQTGKMLGITGRFACYWCCINCLRRPCTHGWLHLCTKCKPPRPPNGGSSDGLQTVGAALS